MYPQILAFCLTLVFPLTSVYPQEQSSIPRTEFDRPNFQGYWTNQSQTPLQRPENLGTQRAYSIEEATRLMGAARQRDAERAAPVTEGLEVPAAGAQIGFQADQNFANTRIDLTVINDEYRTSLIIDPPDGRWPFQEDWRSNTYYGSLLERGAGEFDGPEIRNPWERCFFVGGHLPPMVAWAYNANFQFIQTEDHVVIHREMVHDARIIKINGQFQPSAIYEWAGDSIGHWEGDMLVVNSKGFHPQASNSRIPSSDALQVTERFELVSANEIYYSFVVEDPKIYTQPVTVEMRLQRKSESERIYEYACHEGNYSLPGILAGARRAEVQAESEQ
jgi:hypothetical protein